MIQVPSGFLDSLEDSHFKLIPILFILITKKQKKINCFSFYINELIHSNNSDKGAF